jgi:alkaline phosphatase
MQHQLVTTFSKTRNFIYPTHYNFLGTYAHTASRGWENDIDLAVDCDPAEHFDIAEQLVNNEVSKNFHVILGGGRRNFRNTTVLDEEGSRGYRGDGRDMIDEWKQTHADMGKSEYIWNRQQLKSLDIENTDYVLGLFEADHLRYAIDVRQAGLQQQEPTLADLTETAIKMLQKNDNGYVLFVEG